MEHQRLNDLVFVHYNLHLQNRYVFDNRYVFVHFTFTTYKLCFFCECFYRLKVDKRSYDPIDYECIDKTDFWVVEEEPEGELDYNELENMVDEEEHEPATQT